MYRDSLGVVRDYAEAVHWYRVSARQNHKTAQFNLGRMYENGLGVTRDRAEAVHWYRKASGQGHKSAEIRLKKMGAWKGAGTGGGNRGKARRETCLRQYGCEAPGAGQGRSRQGADQTRLLVFHWEVRQKGFRSGGVLVA
jgi:TPR repeat protein